MQQLHKKMININGTTVPFFYIHIPDHPSSVIKTVHLSGSRYDPKGYGGLAHISEHVLVDFFQENLIDQSKLNVDIYGETFREQMLFTFSQPKDLFPTVLTSLLSLYGHYKNCLDTALLHTKKIIEREVGVAEKQTNFIVHKKAMEILFALHEDLHQDLVGTKISRELIDTDDVNMFINNHILGLNKFAMVCVSGIPYSNLKKDFDLTNGSRTICEAKHGTFEQIIGTLVSLRDGNSEEEVMLDYYFKTCSSFEQKDRLIIQIFMRYLAGAQGSILQTSLQKQKPYIYDWEYDTEYFSDGGYSQVSVQIQSGKLEEVKKILDSEIAKIEQGIVNINLFEKQKNMLADELLHHSQNLDVTANWYADDVLYSKNPQSMASYLEEIGSITPDDLVRIGNKYFKSKSSLIIVS